MKEFFSITLTLFFVIDALGHIPAYLHLLKPYDQKRRKKLAIRELLFALAIMILFNFLGEILLPALSIDAATVRLAGGIVLFLIAVRLIFSDDEGIKWKEQVPCVVPIATPIIAGPSVLAVIMIFSQEDGHSSMTLWATVLAWFLSSLVFLFAQPIFKVFKEKGLNACQRLMGLIVALIAVQLFLQGILEAVK